MVTKAVVERAIRNSPTFMAAKTVGVRRRDCLLFIYLVHIKPEAVKT